MPFTYWHNNPPAPFNPDFLPRHEEITAAVRKEMEAEGYYQTHAREQRAGLWQGLWAKHRAIIYPDRTFKD